MRTKVKAGMMTRISRAACAEEGLWGKSGPAPTAQKAGEAKSVKAESKRRGRGEKRMALLDLAFIGMGMLVYKSGLKVNR